jgi:hypothetical protein
MKVAGSPNEVRQLVAQTFTAFGARLRGRSALEETIVLDGGKYMARSYRSGGLMAMWLVEVGIVQFYDAQGNMLKTADLKCTSVSRKAAA